MELNLAQPLSQKRLEELRLAGVDPLTEPGVVAARLSDTLYEAAGEKLLGKLHQFVLGADSFLRLGNVFRPTNLAPTPETFSATGDTSWYHGGYATLAVLATAQLTPVSFASENNGQLIINLTVLPGVGRKADKSRKDLRGHTDACSFPFAHEFSKSEGISPAPDFVVLIGYRNPDNVPTCVAPLSKIMKMLSDGAIDELQKEQFIIGSQGLFDIDYEREDASVITHHPQYGYQVRFSHSHVTVDNANQPAVRAIEEMEEATQACLQDVVVRPGDILLVNNRTALHGRRTVSTASTGGSGGKTRWIQRLYANLPGTIGMPVDEAVPYCLAPKAGWSGRLKP